MPGYFETDRNRCCTRPQCGGTFEGGSCTRCGTRVTTRSAVNPYTGVPDLPPEPKQDPCRGTHITTASGKCVHCGQQFPGVIDVDQINFNARLIIALKDPRVNRALQDSVQHAINTGLLRT